MLSLCLVVYKVTHPEEKFVSEWDVMAAIGACTDTHVINFSLQFGLGRDCRMCDQRASATSRTEAFEKMIMQLHNQTIKPVFVAAAGNKGRPELAYPARFPDVLAIGSIDGWRELSGFSNYGNKTIGGDNHPYHYVLPGGDGVKGYEYTGVGSFTGIDRRFAGTSFSAAYASGIVASKVAEEINQPDTDTSKFDYRAILSKLKATKAMGWNMSVENYDEEKHGNGILQM